MIRLGGQYIMQNTISLGTKKIEYHLRRSHRAKQMRLSVYPDGRVILTLPQRFPVGLISVFLEKKAAWIVRHLERFLLSPVAQKGVEKDKREYLLYKKRARVLAEERLRHFNTFYGFSWTRVSIRDQKTRWGSCSKKGNLNFNYRIALLPPHLADYIIVHELCHLGAFDHSKRFWELVAQTIPLHREFRRELRAHGARTLLS